MVGVAALPGAKEGSVGRVLDKVSWPVVALITAILAAICVLALAHADTRIIIDVLLALGLGGGLGILSSVRSNVNGNLSKLIDHLAKSQPVDDKDK